MHSSSLKHSLPCFFASVSLAMFLIGCDRVIPKADLEQELTTLERPNLVLIIVDTLRADKTSPYGFEQDTTPELSRWADRGLLFERTRAQSSWTKMSMASLFTSLWPNSHGIRLATDGLSDGATTLAETLKQAGYRTFAVQSNGWLDQSFGFQQGFDRYVFPKSGKVSESLSTGSVWPHADRIYEEAVRIIDVQTKEEPFFLYLHFMDVHQFAAPPEFKTFGMDTEGSYLASIRWTDDAIERVRKKLSREGFLDNTVMVFASDHGETFGEHRVNGHARNVLTPVLHVPLVIRLPFPTEPVRISSQIRNLDIAPTLLDLLGIEIPESFQGESLIPLIEMERLSESKTDRVTFAALGQPLFQDASIQISANDGDWTLARNVKPDPKPGEFLFDRKVDPIENVNLIELEKNQAERMRALLDSHLDEKTREGVLDSDVTIDPEIEKRLRALGYLE